MTRKEHIEIVLRHLTIGALLTHTCCLGAIEDHYYTGMDGNWICGKATKDTRRFGGSRTTNDIAPYNVTHINHQLVEMIEEFTSDS